MKTRLLFLCCLISLSNVYAQTKNFKYKFYGFVRGDLFYDTRDNEATVSDNFYLFPKDISRDDAGKDLNASPSGSFYTFTTRLGLDVSGPKVWGAVTSAKIETDFGGCSISTTMLRIRQAYVNLAWEHHAFLIGQTWHPLFGEVCPNVLNLNTGAPFQPFNRSPQLRYQYHRPQFTITASAIYQLIYCSDGPIGKSGEYLKDGMIPELFAGIDYHHNGFLAGAGLEMLSLKPRTRAEFYDEAGNRHIFKVNERLTTTSFMAQLKYTAPKYQIAAKTIYGKNLGHTVLTGGYAVASENPENGRREYTPYAFSTSWISGSYGQKYQIGAFMGYSKNMGTSKALAYIPNGGYGSALNADQLVCAMLNFSYNLPHWKAGIEFNCTTAYYGDTDMTSGKVRNTHPVTNLRTLGLVMYIF